MEKRLSTQTLSTDALAGERTRFMSRVYLWMTLGLLLTGAVAAHVANTPAYIEILVTTRFLFMGLIIGELLLVGFLAAAINRMSVPVAFLTYFAYAALNGITFSVIFLAYTQSSIASAFGTTAFAFAGLSITGLVLKRDLGPVGAFCTMGLWGIVGVSLASIFFPGLLGGTFGLVYSVVGVIVFAGLTAYDTQKIKNMYALGSEGSEAASKGALYGALTLYLDFINLFIMILRLTGSRR
jgi:FtsH-binding integral membrane protein